MIEIASSRHVAIFQLLVVSGVAIVAGPDTIDTILPIHRG